MYQDILMIIFIVVKNDFTKISEHNDEKSLWSAILWHNDSWSSNWASCSGHLLVVANEVGCTGFDNASLGWNCSCSGVVVMSEVHEWLSERELVAEHI